MSLNHPRVNDQTLAVARRFSPARLLLAVVLTIVGLYAAAIAYLMTQETRLVFQAGRPLGESRPTFPYTQVSIPRADGAAQFAWEMENPGARTWLLFLHGNSATIASRVNIARYRQLRALGSASWRRNTGASPAFRACRPSRACTPTRVRHSNT